jgi:hypothetical protein
MKRALRDTTVEVIKAISPIVMVILVIKIAVISITPDSLAEFLIGILIVAIGFVFFLTGVHVGLLPMGRQSGPRSQRAVPLY